MPDVASERYILDLELQDLKILIKATNFNLIEVFQYCWPDDLDLQKWLIKISFLLLAVKVWKGPKISHNFFL